MLEVNNVSKKFLLPKSLKETFLYPFKKNREICAVNNVSLKLNRGGILALLGPNGAGKTTLIKILSTLILPDNGRIRICGYDLFTQAEQIKPKIGLVLGEEKGFYWRLTGRQNLKFFGVLYNLPNSEIRKRISYIAGLLEIDDLDKPFQNYSCGMKHRLGLAKCLFTDPEVIFLDEPTRSLDPLSAHKFRTLLKERLVKEFKKTVFFTTHQIKEAEELADNIAIMNKGSIKAFGGLEKIKLECGLKKDATLEEIYLKLTSDKNDAP